MSVLVLDQLLQERRRVPGSEPALLAPGRSPATYASLCEQAEQTAAVLAGAGIGRGDAVGIVLPPGPELASAFVGVAAAAVCAPLNPAYGKQEFEFYLSDISVKALILEGGAETPAREAARTLGIPVFELKPRPDAAAGRFDLRTTPAGLPQAPAPASPGDTALILHTSGTTSRPKMVPLSQENLCRSAANIAATLRLTPQDRCLNVMPLFHIHGLVGALLSSLWAGASVVCAPGFQAVEFFRWLDEFSPTWYSAVPTMHQAVLARARQFRETASRASLRFIRSSSAALPVTVLAELEEVFGAPVIESYGMTEAAHQMASNPLPPQARKPGSVGPAAGPEVAIMDPQGRLLLAGEAGEVVIRGPNVTAGYRNNPEANASAFQNGWFRTGDQGRLDEDGYLFLTGRLKEIINQGGEKIAPREVDEVLMSHPAVAQAVAFAIPDKRLGEVVGAAVVLRAGHAATESEIQQHVAARLASFKVPRKVVFLGEIPKGPTGKLQRIGLAAKLGLGAAPQAAAAGPDGNAAPIEQKLAALWREVLEVESVGPADSFLDLGGDSIEAVRLAARISEETGIEVPVFVLFEHPTVTGIAAWLSRQAAGKGRAEISGSSRPEADQPPLSFIQERLWFLQQYEGEKAVFNRPALIRLRGPLDVTALRWGLEDIVRRHEPLRTRIVASEGSPSLVTDADWKLEIPLSDLAEAGEADRLERGMELAREAAAAPFDLARDLMLRARIYRLDKEDHLLLVVMHHVASDGWSSRVLFRELSALYSARTAGRAPDLAPLPIRYTDFARWQRERLQDARRTELIEYWKTALDGAPSLLSLPADRPRPAPDGLVERLGTVSRQENASLFMIMLAAFHVLLHRYTGATDILVGVPVANRLRPETEPLIGAFINTLVLRGQIEEATPFREFLSQVRRVAVDAYAHQELPFEQLVEELRPQRSLSHSPLFQVMFQLRNLPPGSLDLPGVEASEIELDLKTSEIDLSLEVTEQDGRYRCLIIYNTDLFDSDTIARMLGHYRNLLEACAVDPSLPVGKLPMLSGEERERIIAMGRGRRRDYPAVCVHELFEAQADRRPDEVALVAGSERLTYREVEERANQVANQLAARGVAAGDIVGVYSGRGAEIVIGMLGAMKAGAAYLPLDPVLPPARIAAIIADARPKVVLTAPGMNDILPVSEARLLRFEQCRAAPAGRPRLDLGLDSAAYVIYTSGSTGQPKGVPNTHRGLVNLIGYCRELLALDASAVGVAVAAISFDGSPYETLVILAAGGRVVMASEEERHDPRLLGRLLRSSGATFLAATPSMLHMLTESAEGRAAVRGVSVTTGGETLPPALARRALECRARLWNNYGPTEASVLVTFYRVEHVDGPVPLGRPIPNTEAYVLNRSGEPQPIGAPGELCLGGVSLSPGYLNREEETRQRFVPHPFDSTPGARIYRTGDLARFLPDGNIEFLGRLDSQVKIRGFRVELGEIEAALCAHESVRQAAVVLRGDGPEEAKLVAYVAPRDGAEVSPADLRAHLRLRLPDYMTPGEIVTLSELPRTASGKIARGLLPEAPAPPRPPGAPELPPRNDTEEAIAAVWKSVFGIEQIGVEDDFFEIGGHSLTAVRLAAQLRESLRADFPLRALFEYPTIAGFAAYLAGRE